jgi:hypothetical protein
LACASACSASCSENEIGRLNPMASNESGAAGVARDAATIAEISAAFEDEGFRAQFGSGEGGEVKCLTCKRHSPAESMAVEHLRRLEGASDPSDMLAIVALTCPYCDTPGTLILNYGPVATTEDDTILRRLEHSPPPDSASTSA